MPCTYTGSLDGDRAYFTRLELDKATRAACEFGRLLAECEIPPDLYFMVSEETREWFKRHCKQDEEHK